MKVYVVEIYDDLLEDSALYGRAYLTREAAQRRADRMTGVDDGVRYWASVREVEVVGIEEVNAKLREQGARLFDKTLELATENAKLREQLADLAHTTVKCQNGECTECRFGNHTGFGCTWNAHMRELGIEVE